MDATQPQIPMIQVQFQVFPPSATFWECFFPALLAAAPVFLQSLLKCLAEGQSGYNPGTRPRCD